MNTVQELPALLPKPLKQELKSGTLSLGANAKLCFEGVESHFIESDFALIASDFLKPSEQITVLFRLVSEFEYGDEGYTLTVGDESIAVECKSYCGAVYGWQTLKQLIVQYAQAGIAAIPKCFIADSPRYEYRGHMLDVSRHFFGADIIKRQIDLMSALKLNKFHLHLSDDQGFRFESKLFPKLNQIGSKRAETMGDGKEHGGYLTQAELTEIVAYASERAIEVIPEIDLPGHTTAIVASYPELSCKGVPVPVATTFGIKREIVCGGSPKTLEFLKALLSEVASLFPCKYFHLGGDEAPKIEWDECPKCKQAIKDNGLRNSEDLQGWLTNRLIEHLASLGKTAIVWNESLNSGILDERAVCQYWSDGKTAPNVTAAVNSGRKVFISRFTPYYLDYPYGMHRLKSVYALEPELPTFTAEGKANILGVEGPLWAEYVADRAKIDYQTFPRLCAIAEAGWIPSESKDYSDFTARLKVFLKVLDFYKVGYEKLNKVNPNKLVGAFQIVRFFLHTLSKDLLRNAANYRDTQKAKRPD